MCGEYCVALAYRYAVNPILWIRQHMRVYIWSPWWFGFGSIWIVLYLLSVYNTYVRHKVKVQPKHPSIMIPLHTHVLCLYRSVYSPWHSAGIKWITCVDVQITLAQLSFIFIYTLYCPPWCSNFDSKSKFNKLWILFYIFDGFSQQILLKKSAPFLFRVG